MNERRHAKTVRRHAMLALATAIVAASGRAQDGASTLAANLEVADAVVLATVTERTTTAVDLLRVRLVVDEALAGAPPTACTLIEPAAACCGRSLFALQVGDVRLVFLRRSGAAWHVAGGPRGMLPAVADLVAHVRSLAVHRAGPARTALLVAALDAPEPRIADDAALALAAQAGLLLDPAARMRVGDALMQALDRQSPRAAPLLEVAARSADAGLRDALLARYLACPRDAEAALLARGLLRSPVAGTVELAIAGAADEARGMRAAELVASLEPDAAVQACFALLRRTSAPRVQLRACEELLARGVPDDRIPTAPAQVVAMARKRVEARNLRSKGDAVR
jgi:hypothetical protein